MVPRLYSTYGYLSNFCTLLYTGKSWMTALPYAEENMMIMLSLFNTCAGTWRMDKHTDRRTELLYKYPGLFESFFKKCTSFLD